jgi:hypothetical protein
MLFSISVWANETPNTIYYTFLPVAIMTIIFFKYLKIFFFDFYFQVRPHSYAREHEWKTIYRKS